MTTVNKKTSNGYSKICIVALCCMVYFVSYFSRKDFAAVMAGMITDGVIGRGNAGLVGTMLFIFYGVGQLISGYLGDKIRPKYLIIIGLCVTGVCNALMPFIPGGAMIAVWGINGLAQAMLWPPIVKILAHYLDHDTYVSAHLAVTSAAHVSTVLLYVFVPICLSFMSWRVVFITASALAIASMAVFATLMNLILPKTTDAQFVTSGKNNTDEKTEKGLVDSERNIFSILKESGILTVFVCIVVLGFLRDGIESWLPMLYSEAFGKDVSESTLVSMILPVFSIISITLVTALHKRGVLRNEVWGTALLFIISLVAAFPLAVFVSLDGAFFTFASLLLTAFICGAMHGANFLLISCLPGRFARFGRAATVSGVCNSCVYIGAAISTYGIALISEAMGWSLTIISWCAILVIGIIFAILSYKKYSAMLKAEKE
jgi:OPA family glycerol-3-phosphate transporter-like MFS transporter